MRTHRTSPHRPRRPRARPDGFVLVSVAALVLLMGGVTLAFLEEGLSERRSVLQTEDSMIALEIAEAGVARCELELMGNVDPAGDGLGAVAGEYAGGRFDARAVQDPSKPTEWVVTSLGAVRLAVRRIEVRVRVREQSLFLSAMFARDDLRFDGTIETDSYDSRLGTYASQAIHTDAAGQFAEGGGDVGSNGPIGVSGSAATIRGDAIPGVFDTVGLAGAPTIWGSTESRTRDAYVPDPSYEDFLAAYGSNANAKITSPAYDAASFSARGKANDRIVLSGGTYFFTDLTLAGRAQLIVTAPSTVYVTRRLDLGGGGLVNVTGAPADLVVFAHPYPLPAGITNLAGDVSIQGGAQAALALYAPARQVNLVGTGDLFGAVVGSHIAQNGTADFHYDRALGDRFTNGRRVADRLYWRELTGRDE